MKFGIFALASLVLLSVATASEYTDLCSVDAFNKNGNDALSFVSISLALVASAIGLAYMYSRVKTDERVSVWAKDEAHNLLITVLLFVGILVFFTGSCRLAEEYVGKDPISASTDYINTLLGSGGLDILKSLTYSSLNDQKDATYYLYWGFTPFFGSGAADMANYRALSAHKEFVIDLYIPIIASLTAQKYALLAIKWVAASALLPFAFVLRVFPATRDMGNLLIALFFGIYIIVPATYAMSGKIFMDTIVSQPPVLITGVNPFYTYGLDYRSGAGDTRNAVFYKIGSVLPQAIFLPNLVIIITVTCITSIWKALRVLAV